MLTPKDFLPRQIIRYTQNKDGFPDASQAAIVFFASWPHFVVFPGGRHLWTPSPGGGDGSDDIGASLKSFTSVYGLIEQNFADKVDPDKAIYKGAIPGMLHTLDP